MTMLIDPVGNVTPWAFDALNRVVRETDPDGQSRSISYDDAGQVAEVIDRLGRKKQFTCTDAGPAGERSLARRRQHDRRDHPIRSK
jgi:YD repeat-containing protein